MWTLTSLTVNQVMARLWEAFYIKFLLAVMFAGLAPHTTALLALTFLYIVDFICGVLSAARRRTISSAGMRRGIGKGIMYGMFIVVVAAAEHAIFEETQYLTTFVIAMLLLTELISILENLTILGMPVPVLSGIIKTLREKAKPFGVDIGMTSSIRSNHCVEIQGLIDKVTDKTSHPMLRDMVRIFMSGWYNLLRDLEEHDVTGPVSLVNARLESQMKDAMQWGEEEAKREQIAHRFAHNFCHKLMKKMNEWLIQRVTNAVRRTDDPTERYEVFANALTLYLYRVEQASKEWDRSLLKGRMRLTCAVPNDPPTDYVYKRHRSDEVDYDEKVEKAQAEVQRVERKPVKSDSNDEVDMRGDTSAALEAVDPDGKLKPSDKVPALESKRVPQDLRSTPSDEYLPDESGEHSKIDP